MRIYVIPKRIYYQFMDYFLDLNLDDVPGFKVVRGADNYLLTVYSNREFEFQLCGFESVVEV